MCGYFSFENQLDLYFHIFIRSFIIPPGGCIFNSNFKERKLFKQALTLGYSTFFAHNLMPETDFSPLTFH